MRTWIVGLVLVAYCLQPTAVEISLEGYFIQGGLVQGITEPGSKVNINAIPIRVSPRGLFLVGFGCDEPHQVILEIVSPTGEFVTKALAVGWREYAIQSIDGLAPQQVNPEKKALERIQSESSLIVATRSWDDPRIDFLAGFMWPDKGSISGVYGSQRNLNGELRRPHFGVNIVAPVGTPVYAPADGIVTLALPSMFPGELWY